MHFPHAPYHVPPGCDLAADATDSEKHLAMIEHQDTLAGELVNHLESLDLRKRTLLIFTGDNGTPHDIYYQANGRKLEGRKGAKPIPGYWVRTQRWKLYDNGRLYDVRNDPDEEQPIDLSLAPAAVRSVHEQLTKALENSGARAAFHRFKEKSRQ